VELLNYKSLPYSFYTYKTCYLQNRGGPPLVAPPPSTLYTSERSPAGPSRQPETLTSPLPPSLLCLAPLCPLPLPPPFSSATLTNPPPGEVAAPPAPGPCHRRLASPLPPPHPATDSNNMEKEEDYVGRVGVQGSRSHTQGVTGRHI
jgi:hypothetical protein